MAPAFRLKNVVLAMHDAQLVEHGGGDGLRDEGLPDSAPGRPENLAAYGDPAPDLAALAASYAYGIAQNHPFIDGNKRTSLVAAETFLALNGAALTADDGEVVAMWLALAAGEVGQAAPADWIRVRI